MPQVHINYFAVIVAAAAAFAMGGVWYSPLLFAKQWVKAHGFSEQRVEEMQKGASKAYAGSLLCQLLIAFGIAVLVSYLHLWRWLQGLKLGVLIWVGFALPLGLMANMFSDKRITAFYIDAGYQLICLLLMASIVTVWQ